MGAYPAPLRFRWAVMVELPDGNVVYGTSASDLISRWGRMFSWAGQEFDPAQTKQAIWDRLSVFWQTPPDVLPSVDDDTFLASLAKTGTVTVIRKDGY